MDSALDRAHRAMNAGDDAARLAFYERLAATDLVVLLEAEPDGDQISPVVAEVEGAKYLLAFDAEDRLAAFAGGVAPYAGLPGRALAEMIAGQGIGLGLNFDKDATGVLVPADALVWLLGILNHGPETTAARPVSFAPPDGVPPDLIVALEARLTSAAGLAQGAYLTQAGYDGGTSGILLVFVGVSPAAEEALAQTVAETLAFSGASQGSIDVAFLDPNAAVLPTLLRQAREISIPEPVKVQVPKPPGTDAPPRLK